MKMIMKIAKPFDFEATLKTHGWFQLPPFYWDDGDKKLFWAIKPDNRPPILVSVQSIENSTAEQTLEIFSTDNSLSPEYMQHKLRYVLNLDLDLNAFYALCAGHPLLKHVLDRGIGRIMRAESLYEDIFKSICGTNVQWNQAVKMIRNISTLGESVGNSHYRVFPSPVQIINAGDSFLKEVGRVGYRSRYLLAAAQFFLNHDPRVKQAEQGLLSFQELRDFFTGFAGIGPVTARYLTALYGHYNEMAIDSLVISYVSKHYCNGNTATVAEIKSLYAPFGKWQYLAYWMEFIINEGWLPSEPT
ncbi:MAG: hypothetical protein EHM72_17710 [Calditrichaeota bacterium]|nr:MAG: hypothetical protein EHM72_17710 [Calditrichota bacterium]